VVFRNACAFKGPLDLARFLPAAESQATESINFDFALAIILARYRDSLTADDLIASLESLLLQASRGCTDPVAYDLTGLISRVVLVLKQRQPTKTILGEMEALLHSTFSPASIDPRITPLSNSRPLARADRRASGAGSAHTRALNLEFREKSTPYEHDFRRLRCVGILVDLLREWNRSAWRAHSAERPPAAAAQVLSQRVAAPSWQRVVARYRDGRVLRGYTSDFNILRPQLNLSLVPNGGSALIVPLAQLKALFFVRDLAGDPSYVEQKSFDNCPPGRKLEVTFDDGEVLLGSTLSYRPEGHGFFVHPSDNNGNNIRVFVSSAALRHVRFLEGPDDLGREVQKPHLRIAPPSVDLSRDRSAPIDMTGTRRAPRFAVVEGTEVQVDGNVATLVNLSVVGAQICSETVLALNARVPFVFADEEGSISFESIVMSVSADAVNGGTRYRVGIQFIDADHRTVRQLIERKKR
jgi:hypothetical protein